MIATNIEQSRHLVELGIDPQSADMFWLITNEPRLHVLTEPLSKYSNWENYPAWSLDALLDLMPVYLKEEDEEYYLVIEKDVYTNGDIIYRVCYNNWDSLIKLYLEKAKTPIEATYKMVCWLKENEKI